MTTTEAEALKRAQEIIETGDQRLLASDGPAGGQPPDISLDEWRELYQCIRAARPEGEEVEEIRVDPTMYAFLKSSQNRVPEEGAIRLVRRREG